MLLKRIYTLPGDLFETIEFKNGINFIFGKKDKGSDPKESLNGIGKSLLLDLIDFCLLASFDKKSKPRLFKAREYLSDHKIGLDFTVNGTEYVIRRDFNTPRTGIEFGIPDKVQTYSESELKIILCDLIFKNESYDGKYYNTWLRVLLPFFIKIEKPRKGSFIDPIEYLEHKSLSELNAYHLFLLGIKNNIVYKNFDVQANLKQKEPAIREVKKIVEETYGLKDISEARNTIDNIKREVSDMEKHIEAFKLADEYKNVEEEANELTSKIKELLKENYFDRKRIESFQNSFQPEKEISPIKIRNLYKDLNTLLSDSIKKTLDEAIAFRKNIAKSRQEFLKEEIENINKSIQVRDREIEDYDNKRRELFSFLSAKEAIKDLSEAYLFLSKKREESNELSSKTRLYSDLIREKADLKSEEAKLVKELLIFIESIQDKQVSDFRAVVNDVYNSAYAENKNKSLFTFDYSEKTSAKLNINISIPADLSKGKNRGRTLVYDLSVLFHAIDKNIRCPRFLIHDGIFDGMDKGHFIHLYEFLEAQKGVNNFQYIVALNEEGTLSESFGHAEKVNPTKIEEEAIKVLTPSNKLLGVDFD